MKQYTFNWEIQTLLEQFTAAFNDIVIKKYNKDKEESGEDVSVRFMYAPKQRVVASLSTPGPGGITLPVISINQTSLSRDTSRVFNKLEGFNLLHNSNNSINDSFLKKIPQPVPVDIQVSMTIVTKYQADMDQIVSNFVPYCDPYIVISSKLPGLSGSNTPFELRTSVIWSGQITYGQPIDIGPNQPYRITADTSFTIKGWLFKRIHENMPRVFNIDVDYSAPFNPLLDYSLLDSIKNPYDPLSKGIPIERYENFSDIPVDILNANNDLENGFTKTTSAKPSAMYTTPKKIVTFEGDLESLTNLNIDIHGEFFIQTKQLFVSGSNPSMFSGISSFDFFGSNPKLSASNPSFSGVAIPHFYILNDRHINFNLPEIPQSNGYFDIIVLNDSGYNTLLNSNFSQNSGVEVTSSMYLF